MPTSIIMAGGKGTRLSPFKPVLEVCKKPMIRWVIETAWDFSDQVFIATTRNHPIEPMLRTMDAKILYTSGYGYEVDVLEAVSRVERPTIVFPSDVPLIPKDAINLLISECRSSICSLLSRSEFIGVSIWKGLTLDNYQSVTYPGLIINVNTKEDYEKINKNCP
ncbi:MAG: NTP transferase domain-containing protein [Metallosphaera sp.]|nr:NTP transferase domain-containing protein [Metallosphaera cuprina]